MVSFNPSKSDSKISSAIDSSTSIPNHLLDRVTHYIKKIYQEYSSNTNKTQPKKDYCYSSPKDLLKAAKKYMSKDKVLHKPSVNYKISDKMTEKEMIDALLDGDNANTNDYQGFFLGENHQDRSPKEFLVDNMEYLKNKGVKVIFMEQFQSNVQADLDAYMAGAPLSPWIIDQFEFADEDYHALPGYGYRGILEAAKKAGIRIVAIDAPTAGFDTSEEEGLKNRIISMNYFAYKTMKQTLREMGNCKFVGLTGSGHLSKRRQWIQGIATLLGCPYMVVSDKKNASTSGERIQFNQYTESQGLNSDICADVLYHRQSK